MGMGYQGFARLYQFGNDPGSPMPGGNNYPTSPLILLCTTAGVNIALEPIYSSSVWGAGWYNAPMSAHYADSALRYEGNIDIELQASQGIWNLIRTWAIEQRAWPRSLDISPDGQSLYHYWVGTLSDLNNPATLEVKPYETVFDVSSNCGAWVQTMNFNTSQGSFVLSSINIIAIYRIITTPAPPYGTGTDPNLLPYIRQRTGYIARVPADIRGLNPLNPAQTNVNPIPFWKTNARLYDVTPAISHDGTSNWSPADWPASSSYPQPWQAGTEATDWGIDLTNNTQPLYTCSGVRYPTAILMGPIEATGNVTLFHTDGVWDPVFPPAGDARTAENSAFRIRINTSGPTASPQTYVNIDLPAVVIETDDFSLKGQSEVTTRTYNFKGMGGRTANADGTIAGPNGTDTLYPPLYMGLM